MKKTYKSEALEAIHETAEALHSIGIITKKKLKSFDKICLKPIPKLTADEIRAIREREGLDVKLFAKCLNISTDTVYNWEKGKTTPNGCVLKLLNLVKKGGLKSVM